MEKGYTIIGQKVLERLENNEEYRKLQALYNEGKQLEEDAYLEDWTEEEGKIWLYDYDFQKFESEVNKSPAEIEKLEEELKNTTGFFKRKTRDQLQRQIYQRKNDLAEAKHHLELRDKFQKFLKENCEGKTLGELKKQLDKIGDKTIKSVFYENLNDPDVDKLFTIAICEKGIINTKNMYSTEAKIAEVVYKEARLVIKKKYEKEIAERRNEVALGKKQETDEENE